MRAATLLCSVLLGTAAACLAACGSQRSSVVVETVTVPAQRTSPSTSTVPTTTNPQRTRTGPSPAFVQRTGGTPATPTGEVAAAVRSLTSRGYAPISTSTYRTSQTLRVLIGSSNTGQKAFFFKGDRYLGTDATSASRSVGVVDQGDTSVTLRYTTSAGPKDVRFQLDQGRLTAVDTIPDAASRR